MKDPVGGRTLAKVNLKENSIVGPGRSGSRRKGDARPCKTQRGQGRDSGRPRGVKAGKGFAFLKYPYGYHVEEVRRHR